MPPATAAPSVDPRTRRLLEAPLAPLLLRMAAPNVLVLLAQSAAGLIETYFVGRLGVAALGGVSLVFPVVMLMQMLSAGAVGGGIASGIARALGGRRQAEAADLAMHALVIAIAFGLASTAFAWLLGPALYARMGGSGEALRVALTYSGWVFAGATLVWLFNAMASIVRGTGNMALPAVVTLVGTALLVPLSPLLIFGWGAVPGLGVAGGAIALLVYYAFGCAWLAWHLFSGRGVVVPQWRGFRVRAAPLVEILRIGLAGAISTVATNVSIAIATGFAGQVGTGAIAGYGTGSRIEYLLVPLVFGLGSPLVAIVATSVGAGDRDRALRATWVGALMAGALAESIGLLAAAMPTGWMRLFTDDPAAIEAGVGYLRIVAPFYGFFGVALLLYFASQGAGRLLWPTIGNLARLAVAALGGWLALRAGWGLAGVFAAQAAALVVYGATNAAAIAAGAWFGQPVWRRAVPVSTRPPGVLHEA